MHTSLQVDFKVETYFEMISSEFLRGREEGEVEIFAHDSFPTYFRQVAFPFIKQPFLKAPFSIGDGRPLAYNLSTGRPPGWSHHCFYQCCGLLVVNAIEHHMTSPSLEQKSQRRRRRTPELV